MQEPQSHRQQEHQRLERWMLLWLPRIQSLPPLELKMLALQSPLRLVLQTPVRWMRRAQPPLQMRSRPLWMRLVPQTLAHLAAFKKRCACERSAFWGLGGLVHCVPSAAASKLFLERLKHASIVARGYNHARRVAAAVLLVKAEGGRCTEDGGHMEEVLTGAGGCHYSTVWLRS